MAFKTRCIIKSSSAIEQATMVPPPLPASLSERLKSTIDPMTGNCKHHPSIQLCQLVANGTRWSIKRKVCIKCGSRTPVGGFDRRKPGKAVTNPGRPAPGKLNPKERAEAERKEREEAFGTLREREARRLQKEMEAATESAANSFDGPPSEVVALLSSSDDSRTRSSDEDRFNIRQRSASRLRDNYRSRDSKGRDKEQRQGRQNRSPSRPRERQNRSPSRPERKGRSASRPRERSNRSPSRTRDSHRHQLLALLGNSVSDDEPEFDERRIRSASRPRDRNMRRDDDVDWRTRQQRSSSRPRERIENVPSRGKEKSFRSKSSSRGRIVPPPLDYYEDYLVRNDRMAQVA